MCKYFKFYVFVVLFLFNASNVLADGGKIEVRAYDENNVELTEYYRSNSNIDVLQGTSKRYCPNKASLKENYDFVSAEASSNYNGSIMTDDVGTYIQGPFNVDEVTTLKCYYKSKNSSGTQNNQNQNNDDQSQNDEQNNQNQNDDQSNQNQNDDNQDNQNQNDNEQNYNNENNNNQINKYHVILEHYDKNGVLKIANDDIFEFNNGDSYNMSKSCKDSINYNGTVYTPIGKPLDYSGNISDKDVVVRCLYTGEANKLGDVFIYIVWLIGGFSLIYSVYYFRKLKMLSSKNK